MLSFWQAILLVVLLAAVIFAAVFCGGWLVFKGQSQPGSSFFKTPKGEVFSIPEIEEAEEFPEEEVLKKTERFLNILGGKT